MVIYVFLFVVSCSIKKRDRRKYKSKTLDIKTKCGGKVTIMIPNDIERVVITGARDIINYSDLIMRSIISFEDGSWQKIVSKYGDAMWLKVKVINYFQFCIYLRLLGLLMWFGY